MEISASDLILGLITAGGGASAIAFAIFRFLTTSWLENKFTEKLEGFRHENAKDLQRLRVEIDSALNASIRSQEKEFEAITEAWRLANIALGQVQSFVNPYQSYQDLNKMSVELREEYLERFDLLDAQRSEILSAENPLESFMEALFWIKSNEAEGALGDYRYHLFLSEIFIPANLLEHFRDVNGILRDALTTHQVQKRIKERDGERYPYRMVRDEALPILEKLGPKLRDYISRSRSPLNTSLQAT